MCRATPHYETLDEWIAREAIPFDIDSPGSFNAAVDRMMEKIDDSVDVLGLGEPFHGDSEFLTLRNRLFERLVEGHGFSAIAIESSFPRGRIANDYVEAHGRAQTFEQIAESGFSHGFGKHGRNRELIEWMRRYNSAPSRSVKLRFYGFDSPTEMGGAESPRQLLEFALSCLATIDSPAADARRRRIEPLLEQDWEQPGASFDPAKSVGNTQKSGELRIETEELITTLKLRRPELVAATDREQFEEALRYAEHARQMLTYHAAMARSSSDRIAELLGIRDVMMADNLTYIAHRERPRGKVFAFAHNSHLMRGRAKWQFGPHALRWWTAGAHLDAMLGERYVVIGSGVGTSPAFAIAPPEPGTLEAKLAAAPGPSRLVRTYRGRGLPADQIASLPTRSGSQTYFPFTRESIREFDWLVL